MIKSLKFALLLGLVGCTTIWTRKKPAYWAFPETSTTERPDLSMEYCKSVNMVELGTNITRIVSAPVRGQSETLLHAVVLYVLTLHRFIRKTNTTDDIAIRMAKDLVTNQRPMFLDMDLDMPLVNTRVGFEKYEFQHFQLVWEDIQQSWQKLKGILLGETEPVTTQNPRKRKAKEESEELKLHHPYQEIDGLM